MITHRIPALFHALNIAGPYRQMHPSQRPALPAEDPTARSYKPSPFAAHKSVHTSSPDLSATHEDARNLSMANNRAAGCRMVPAEVEAFYDEKYK